MLQKLAWLMKGDITVNSNPGEGSVFELTVTLGLPPEPFYTNWEAGCVKPDQKPTADHEKLRGARVILVDTHPVRQVSSIIHTFLFRYCVVCVLLVPKAYLGAMWRVYYIQIR